MTPCHFSVLRETRAVGACVLPKIEAEFLIFIKKHYTFRQNTSPNRPCFTEIEKVTWCTGLCMISRKYMNLKNCLFGNPPEVQFWNCCESKESICIPNVSVNSRSQGFKLPKWKSVCISNGFERFSKKTTFKK